MPEFDLPRLTVLRQRRVAQSLGELSEDKTALKAMHADVREALVAAVAAGGRLSLAHHLPPLLVDNTSDVVISAFERAVGAIEDGLTDRVVPLNPEQTTRRNAARLIRRRAFPDGTGFLTDAMSLQYRAMRTLADTLRAPDCAKAVATLDLGYFVAHIEAHLAPYGRAVKTTDDRDVEADSDAFHAAFIALALVASVHHRADAIGKQLMAAYDTELEAQRADERESRRRAAARKRGDNPG